MLRGVSDPHEVSKMLTSPLGPDWCAAGFYIFELVEGVFSEVELPLYGVLGGPYAKPA